MIIIMLRVRMARCRELGADALLRTNKHTYTDTYINTYIPTRDLAHSPAPLFNIHSLPSAKKYTENRPPLISNRKN